MASLDSAQSNGFMSGETWTWWQARRLRYNIALGAAGWIAYGLFVTEFYAFGRPVWKDWQGAASMTLFLGAAFLVLMGIANVCFLLGPWTEKVARPVNVQDFRTTAWRMGFFGSIAVPFLFPLVNFAMLLGGGGSR